MKTVVVTWMDDKQEVYRCNEIRSEDRVLRLYQPHYPANDEPHRFIPLDNVRIWTVDNE